MQYITRQQIHFLRWLLPVVVCVLLSVAGSAVAATTVTNSVRVSADGSGESHASVTTAVNGEVVEDWTATSNKPISYTHSFATTSATVQSQAITDEPSSERDQLVELIAHLQALIALYVSLLTS